MEKKCQLVGVERAQRFRGYRPPLLLQGRTVIVVDDGIATGATARAALRLVSHRGAGRVVLAVPVGPPETAGAFGGEADEVVVLLTPANFVAVGYWYDDFSQVTDEQVARLLVVSDLTTQRNDADPPAVDEEVEVV